MKPIFGIRMAEADIKRINQELRDRLEQQLAGDNFLRIIELLVKRSAEEAELAKLEAIE